MARGTTTASKPQTKRGTGTAVTNWEAELAAQAEVAAAMEANSGGGKFFSIQGGQLQFDGAPLPGNKMAVIIVDAIMENAYYDVAYDPTTPASPVCFAFGRDEQDMAPHETVDTIAGFERQAEQCHGCPMNVFGSADRGRGKACRNARRLALIPAGSFDAKGNLDLFDEDSHFAKTPIAFMKLPPSSLNSYGAYVKQVAGVLKRPPHGVVTQISVIPDAKTQFKVMFEVIEKVDNAFMGSVMQRHTEAEQVIDFPYTPIEAEPAPPARGRGKPAPKGKQANTKRKY